MLHQCDLPPLLLPFSGKYECHLNSEDLYDPALLLDKVRAYAGTMILWECSLSSFITLIPSVSPSFSSILLNLPGTLPSIHTVVYLPTSGREDQFMTSLVELQGHIEDARDKHPEAAHFLRGDANCNPNNTSRFNLFNDFCANLSFKRVPLNHPTYHHFVGNGNFDSEIDVLLFHGKNASEALLDIICKNDCPIIDSHHDVLLSTCVIPSAPEPHPDTNLVVAPKVKNDRIKILWNDDGINEYQNLIGSSLASLRERWANSSSSSSISLLLSSTYSCLSFAASSTNKFVELSSTRSKKAFVCPEVRKNERNVIKFKKAVNSMSSSPHSKEAIMIARENLCLARAALKKSVRAAHSRERIRRDENLSSILSTNPSSAFRSIKASKNASSTDIQNLKVKNKTYSGENVPDGFYDSLSTLKAPDLSPLYSSPHYQSTLLDYENVLKIARHGGKIPHISPKHSTELLHSLKADVNDYFSITASHFLHAGFEGLEHFHFLLNIIIDEVNLSTLEELNTVWACILWKGHGKDKESDRSYRTISTCPLLAKALDSYIGELYSGGWAAVQASTQFQGNGSSHELAALLLTESINYSLFCSKKPVFILLLDAKSAFDLIPRQNIIVNAFKAGTCDQALLYLNNRLASRRTFCEWSKVMMGPIHDQLGVEQGGVNSDRLYKLANNNQLVEAQRSQLGVDLGSTVVSCIGQADDSVLLSHDIFSLQNLLLLTIEYCQHYNVTLVPEKTKMLAFTPPGLELMTEYAKIISPVSIDGSRIPFSESAEHVGIIRSIHGNSPNILSRLSSHRRAVFSLLPSGLAKGHRGNPAGSIRVERLYGIPVLLSGLAPMVLSIQDISTLSGHFKRHVERLLKLHRATPDPVVWFLAGCLPIEALLHLRQASIFGMITRLNNGNNVLANHAREMLATGKASSKSWFLQIRSLFLLYNLPHPITFLNSPTTKFSFKRLVKTAVLSHWQDKLRAQASILPSLEFFKPGFMSLSKTHPIFTSCGNNPYEILKACTQARALSGRAKTEYLARHWDPSNKEGLCRLCWEYQPTLGTVQHLLLPGGCPALADARLTMLSLFNAFMVTRPYLLPIFQSCWNTCDKLTMQLLLDCSTIPMVISVTQESESPILADIFYLTRTYCFKVFTTRRRLLQTI